MKYILDEDIVKEAQAITEHEERLMQQERENLHRQALHLDFLEHGGVRKRTEFEGVSLVQCKKFGYFCLLDSEEHIIVPFERYSFIDAFEHGYARVNKELDASTQKRIWGIIDTNGVEVVPLEYDYIYPWIGKKYETTRMKLGNDSMWFHFLTGEISSENPWPRKNSHSDAIVDHFEEDYNDYCDYEGNLDLERLEDAYLDGEYLPEDW